MFGFEKKVFIGIDIGTSNIKIVELKISGNKPVLTNYSWISISNLMSANDLKLASFDAVLPEYLKRMLKESKIKSRRAFLSMPAFGGLITTIEFPNMNKDDLDQAIKFEARKYIPSSLEDIVLSWDVIGKQAEQKVAVDNIAEVTEKNQNSDVTENPEKIQILLVAAPKDKVIKYEKLIGDIGLQLESIEIESFSLVRSLIGNDQGNFVIVDIGSRVCNIVLVEKGIIKANRNIDSGGKDISRVIARSMNIDDERAEKLKISGKDFLNKESGMNFPAIDLIINEIARVLSAYYKGEAKTVVDGIIISGGTAGLKGIENCFFKALGIKTIIGNPFSRIEYDKKIESKLKIIGNQFSVAVGLALAGIERYSKK